MAWPGIQPGRQPVPRTATDGSLKVFGYRGPQRSIEVDLQAMRAVTTDRYDEELTDEEWLGGWRHQVLEAARPKPFAPECSFCGKTDKEVLRLRGEAVTASVSPAQPS